MTQTPNPVSGTILSPEALLSYPNLFVAVPYMRNGRAQGEPKFSATLVFAAGAKLVVAGNPNSPEGSRERAGYTSTWDLLKQVAKQVADAKWPGRDPKELRWPFKTGNNEIIRLTASTRDKPKKPEHVAYLKDTTFIKVDSKFAPFILGPDKKVIDAARQGDIYAGCIVTAELNFVAYPKAKEDDKDGVKAYLNGVLKLRDGTRLAGRDAQFAFAGISGGVGNYDPTGGDVPEDEIPY